MLSAKNLVFKERPVNKLTKRYIRLYIVKKIVLKNTVKLKLLVFIRIHLVVKYRELVKRQKIKELKPVEVNRVEK